MTDSMRPMSLGQRIKGARLARGYMNAAAFARHCGVSKQYLGNLEKDKVTKPDPGKLDKIAVGAGVSMEWLLSGVGLPDRSHALSSEEQELVRIFRALTEDNRTEVIGFLKFKKSGQNKKG